MANNSVMQAQLCWWFRSNLSKTFASCKSNKKRKSKYFDSRPQQRQGVYRQEHMCSLYLQNSYTDSKISLYTIFFVLAAAAPFSSSITIVSPRLDVTLEMATYNCPCVKTGSRRYSMHHNFVELINNCVHRADYASLG